jgi:streptomycin 6-kinase
MTKDQLRRVAPEDDRPPILPDEFQPAMQSILAILADIDFAHEREVEKVSRSGLDDVFKSSLIAKLDQLHRERRQPYAQELVRLQHRFRSLRSREPV